MYKETIQIRTLHLETEYDGFIIIRFIIYIGLPTCILMGSRVAQNDTCQDAITFLYILLDHTEQQCQLA